MLVLLLASGAIYFALRWRIALRDDGRRLRREGLPVLIEWGDVHPTDTLPDRGLRLLDFNAHDGLTARLAAPLGDVELTSIA